MLVLTLITTLGKSRSEAFVTSAQCADLFVALATVLDAISERAASMKGRRPERLLRKLNVRVWRTLRPMRAAFPDLIKLLTTKTPVPARAAVLLGHIVSVALRAKPAKGQPEGRAVIESQKVSRRALGSELTSGRIAQLLLHPHPLHQDGAPAPRACEWHCHACTDAQLALREFLANFVTEADLTGKLIPTAERMMLRSPEIALTREYSWDMELS